MTREEHISNLETIGCDGWTVTTDAYKSLQFAIQALEQEPCEVFDEYGNYKYPSDVELTEPNTATSMPCEDVVSRQAVNEIINDIRDCISVEGYWAFLERLKKLPPVHSQPNKEDIHREREQAYMCGFEDGSRKYRIEQSEDKAESEG